MERPGASASILAEAGRLVFPALAEDPVPIEADDEARQARHRVDGGDVEQALACTIAQAIYPDGTAAASATGTPARISRGWPAPTSSATIATTTPRC